MVPTPILWTCAFVVAAVFAVMLHSIATFRRSTSAPDRGAAAASPREIPRAPSALAEILWAIVPIFIMVSTALPAVRMLASRHATSIVQAHNEP
jgi:heme/copper-type cytochrome/quinol oxidase subunit 2